MLYYSEIINVDEDSYLYDATNNSVTYLNHDLHELLIKDYLTDDELATYEKLLEESNLRDVKKPYHINFLKLQTPKGFENLYSTNIKNVVLSLTEHCNINCTYCIYQNKNNTEYKKNEMSWELLKECIDYGFKNSVNKSTIIFGFYGGEPLLKFNLIKQGVSYINSNKLAGKKAIYVLTTNGLLLDNKNIVDFLVKNDFYISISLDGPEKIHNRFRVDHQGRNTYQKVIDNIRYIKKKYPEYYSNLMGFSCVNIYEKVPYFLYDYFVHNNIASYRFGMVNKTDYFKNYIEKYDDPIENLSKTDYYDIFTDKEIEKDFYDNNFKQYSSINQNSAERITELNIGNCCMPGFTKLYINNNGDFFPCEKLDESNEIYKIGSVHDGVDFKKIETMINMQNKVANSKCENCWAALYCSNCYYIIDGKNKRCDKLKKYHKNNIKDYIKYYLFSERYLKNDA